MKAVVFERYGPPDVLKIKDVKKPVPKDNELLVKVYATSVTAGDWRIRTAQPIVIRIIAGLFKPTRIKILGFELAGVIEEVGAKVKSFKKGDEVFAGCGLKFGAYAEYKCLPENDLVVLKPSNMSFREAATVPIGGVTALRYLQTAGVKSGQDILIYGASGSVGTFSVQLAKHFGANVTAVCSTANIELVASLGADHLIDYTQQDFTTIGTQFDVVFDAVGKTSRSACKKLLKPGGKFVSVWGSHKKGVNDLLTLKTLIEAGKLRTVIDRTYSLDQIRDAHAYVEQFRKKGNVSVKVLETLP